MVTSYNLHETNLPEKAVTPNFNLGFAVKVEEVFGNVDLRVKKLAGFEKRIADIFGILNPKGEWECSSPEYKPGYVSLGRRLLDSLSNPLEHNRETLMTLERLIHGRYQRDEPFNPNANAPAPVRNLNINDIYQHLEEFTAPIVPRLPEVAAEPMDIEVPPQNVIAATEVV